MCSILLTGLQSCRLHFTMKQNAGSSQGHNMQSCSNFKLPKPQGRHLFSFSPETLDLSGSVHTQTRGNSGASTILIHKVWAVLFPFQLGLPASRSFSCDLRLHCKSSKNCGRPDRLQRFFFALHGFSRFFSLLRCRARSFAAPAMQQQLLAQCICAQLLPATLVESREIMIMGKMTTVTVQASIIGPKIWESSSACSFGRCSSSLQQFTGRRLEEPMSLDRRLSSKEQRAKSCIETWLMTQR